MDGDPEVNLPRPPFCTVMAALWCYTIYFDNKVNPAYKAHRYHVILVVWQILWLSQLRPCLVIMVR